MNEIDFAFNFEDIGDTFDGFFDRIAPSLVTLEPNEAIKVATIAAAILTVGFEIKTKKERG